MQVRKLIKAIALTTGFIPAMGAALGVSDIKLNSALNQPLDAQVTVFDLGETPVYDIDAKVATVEQFERIGITRPAFVSNLIFDVRPEGKNAVVHIQSEEPLDDPVFSFLLSVSTNEGEVIRQFTLFLDPPEYAQFSREPRTTTKQLLTPTIRKSTTPVLPVPQFDESVMGHRVHDRPAEVQIADGGTTSTDSVASVQMADAGPDVTAAPDQSPYAHRPRVGTVQPAQAAQTDSSLPSPKSIPMVTKAADIGRVSTTPAAKMTSADTPAQIKQTSANTVKHTSDQSSQYGPVASHESLWKIADSLKPENITREQALLAIYDANPQAFAYHNINGLKKGRTLTIPSQAQMQAVNKQQAKQFVAKQRIEWSQRHTLSTPPARKSIVPATDVMQDMSTMPTVAEAKPEVTEPVIDQPGRELPLADVDSATDLVPEATAVSSAPSLEADVAMPVQQSQAQFTQLQHLQAELALTADALNTAKQTNQDLNTRMQALEHQNQLLRQLLEKQQQGMDDSATTEQLAEPSMDMVEQDEAFATTMPAIPASKTFRLEGDVVDPRTGAAIGKTIDSTALLEQAQQAMQQAQQGTGQQGTMQLGSQMGDIPEIPGLGLLKGLAYLMLLMVAGTIGWVVWMRRQQAAAEQTVDLPESIDLGTAPHIEKPIDTAPPVLDTDAAQTAEQPVEKVSAEDSVDSLDEADVFIAYGRYAQAMGVITVALANEPNRVDLKIKLLEIYAHMKDKLAFDEVLAGLPSDLQQSDEKLWKQVETFKTLLQDGHKAETAEQEEQSAQSTEQEIEPAPMPEAEEVAQPEQDKVVEQQAVQASEEVCPETESLEKSIAESLKSAADKKAEQQQTSDDAPTEQDKAAPQDDTGGNTMEFSSHFDQITEDTAKEKQQEKPVELAEENVMGFDKVDIDTEKEQDTQPAATEVEQGLEFSAEPDVELSVADQESEQEADTNACEEEVDMDTQLDLARVYIDMGDYDEARPMLENIAANGDEQQQQEAKQLLDKMN